MNHAVSVPPTVGSPLGPSFSSHFTTTHPLLPYTFWNPPEEAVLAQGSPNHFPSPSSELPPSPAPPHSGFLLLCLSYLCCSGSLGPSPGLSPFLPSQMYAPSRPSPHPSSAAAESCLQPVQDLSEGKDGFSLQPGAPLRAGLMSPSSDWGPLISVANTIGPIAPGLVGLGSASHCFGR